MSQNSLFSLQPLRLRLVRLDLVRRPEVRFVGSRLTARRKKTKMIRRKFLFRPDREKSQMLILHLQVSFLAKNLEILKLEHFYAKQFLLRRKLQIYQT
jgi:hypothetical protein